MPSTRKAARTPKEAGYLEWRGDLLAQLAFARIPGLYVLPCKEDYGPSYLVVTSDGVCFFVVVRTFSSFQRELTDLDQVSELAHSEPADLIRQAGRSHCPVLLFLFDADTDHGRYVPLSALAGQGDPRTLRFPLANIINRQNLERMIEDLRRRKAG